jgi:hypothetical protein
MASFVQFRCDPWNDRNASRLCFYGSDCGVPDSISSANFAEYCRCTDGYLHDNLGGHFPNCGLPRYALAIMFGVITATTLMSLYVGVPIYFELRSGARKAFRLQLFVLSFGWLVYLTLWIEQGMYEAPLIFMVLRNVSNFHSLAQLTLMFTAPVYALVKGDYNRIRRRIRGIEGFSAIGQVVIIIPALIFCRDLDPWRYNSVMAVFFAFVSVGSVTMSVVILKQIDMLSSRIAAQLKASPNPKLLDLVKRLSDMHRINIILIFAYSCYGIFPICFIALGSLPGQYIILFIFFSLTPYLCARGAMTLRIDAGAEASSVGAPNGTWDRHQESLKDSLRGHSKVATSKDNDRHSFSGGAVASIMG